MRAIRDTKTGWLYAWWDELPPESEPDPTSGQELIEMDVTSVEFEAELLASSGLDEIAGAYVTESGDAEAASGAGERGPKDLREAEPEAEPREILRGRARLRAEPPMPSQIEDVAPGFSLLLQYATKTKKRASQNITYADLQEMSRMVARREIGDGDV